MKKALITGAGGFIGSHLATRLKQEGYDFVRGIDLKYPEFSPTSCDEFIIGDLRDHGVCQNAVSVEGGFDLVACLAADMGGAGFVFTGDNDADIMHNSASINLNILDCLRDIGFAGKVFYSSSACMYPESKQTDTENVSLKESDGYPGAPDSEYGWEKLFSERLYAAYKRNYGFKTCMARFHNIFGPEGTFDGGREKSPAAMCRKVAKAQDGDEIEVWGDGKQTRSFLYIDECIDGVLRLINSDYDQPINIGSDEMISINGLAQMAIDISGKNLSIKNVPSNALGVRGRNSDNTLIKEVLNWSPTQPLRVGMDKTYEWINKQVNGNV